MDDAAAGSTGGASPAPPEPGSVHVLLGSRKTRVVLTGEVDAELGPELLEASADAEAAARPVEVDAQHVTFMDSTGVAFLARLASRSPGKLVLIKPPDLVRFLIKVTSIRQVLDVVEEDPGIDATVPPDSGGPLDDPEDDQDDPDDDPDLIA